MSFLAEPSPSSSSTKPNLDQAPSALRRICAAHSPETAAVARLEWRSAAAYIGDMQTNIPMDLLRSLVAIADTGSMARATTRIYRTQSALSLQMRRLETLLQISLFRRDGRHLALTSAGEQLLIHAREILKINDRAVQSLTQDAMVGNARIGLVQDFAETMLVNVLARFAKLNPDAAVHVRVSTSHDLNEMLDNDQLDVVLCLGDPVDRSAVTVADLIWLGDPTLVSEPMIPLAVLDQPCLCRDAGLEAIRHAGLDYRIVVETPNLSVLMGAVKAGVALTCRPSLLLTSDVTPICLEGLPLPKVAYVLRTKTPVPPAIARLTRLLEATLREISAS